MRLMQLQVKMPEKGINMVFTSKQTTNKVTSNILRGVDIGTKLSLMF